MKEFNSIEELRNDEDLQNMRRYEFEKVRLDDKEVFACSTNQQYEDIIWGDTYEMLEELSEHFNIDIDSDDLASTVRDFVLEQLEANGVEFVDVFEEY